MVRKRATEVHENALLFIHSICTIHAHHDTSPLLRIAAIVQGPHE